MFRPTRYGFRSPWQEFERTQRDMSRIFNTLMSDSVYRTAPRFPAMNVWTNPEGVVVTAELPGINPDDIDISVVNDTLTLSGNRTPEVETENVRYHRRERGFGEFTRSFQLPFSVEADNVEAVFENGILQISLPRAEAEKPRKIAVKTA